MPYVPTKVALKVLGVHPNTLRAWADSGKIKSMRISNGHRLYDLESLNIKNETAPKRRICYARVSSATRKEELQQQVQLLKAQYPHYEIIQDIGSALSFKRKGLIQILEALKNSEVDEIVVTHRDRLGRFGVELIEWLLIQNGGRLVTLGENVTSPQDELSKDLLAIMHHFGFRMRELRKYRELIKSEQGLTDEDDETLILSKEEPQPHAVVA